MDEGEKELQNPGSDETGQDRLRTQQSAAPGGCATLGLLSCTAMTYLPVIGNHRNQDPEKTALRLPLAKSLQKGGIAHILLEYFVCIHSMILILIYFVNLPSQPPPRAIADHATDTAQFTMLHHVIPSRHKVAHGLYARPTVATFAPRNLLLQFLETPRQSDSGTRHTSSQRCIQSR